MEIKLIGEITILRSVSLKDAEFISNLRSDLRVNKYLSSSKPINISEQIEWLRKYLSKNDGFYFIIENKVSLKKLGTISLYNLEENIKAEFGRYISTDAISAIEAEYLLLQFAFKVLNLNVLYCRTADLNTKVWKQHLSFGFLDKGFELLDEKNLLLRKQEISKALFKNFDYSSIVNLIKRFNRQ
jgi:RimJ/RimL family protein N-acetyltransferase